MSHGYGADVVALQVVVLAWQTWWMARSLGALARGDQRTISFVQIVFYFFFAVPQLLDLTVGPPVYGYFRGFALSQYDHATNLIYLGYLAFVPVGFAWFGGRPLPASASTTLEIPLGRWARTGAWAAMVVLPFVVLLAPQPSLYLEYAAFIGHRYPGAESYHLLISLVALLAAVGAVLVLSTAGSTAIARVATVPFLSIALWVHGKRSIVALTLLMLLYLLWMRGVLRGRRFVVAALAALVLLGGFSYGYQSEVRDVTTATAGRDEHFAASNLYFNYRIDYGRDAVTKQTIYAELNPDDIRILDYRGQSLVFDLLFFVPRAMWPGKPFPYGVYVTSALFDVADEDLGWGVTTSWLEEAIANFSWLGIIIGPWLPALVCKLGDRRRAPLTALLTLATASFLLLLQLSAFQPVAILWAIVLARTPKTAR